MRRKMLNSPVYLVLFSLSVLLLLPINAMAEGDGGWTTPASPGHIFQIEEDLYNNKKHLVMTVLKADETHEIHWGPASGSVNSTYLLESMNGESDMKTTWQFNSVTEATVTVESCSTNCLWQPGQVVTLNKFFGDMVSAANLYVEPSGSCGGKTPCYYAIQEAINAADSGDIIKLAEGIYAETFVLNSDKQLILQGGWDVGFTKQTPRTTVIRAPVITKGSITFQEVVIMEITWPFGNATTADVLDGKTFSSDMGTGLTGIMPNRGGMSYTPTTMDQPIAAGYYNGSGKVEGDSNLVSGNIKDGVTIFGVEGTFPSDGTAVAGDVKIGSTFYSTSGNKLTGTATVGTDVSGADGSKTFTIPDGLYSGSKTATANDTDLVAANIKCGKTIFSVTGTLSPGCVAKTGQIYCYNASGSITNCTGTGQDGEYQQGCDPAVIPDLNGGDFGNYKRTSLQCSSAGFTDNGDGTVTDNLTGLIWLKNANCFGHRTWTLALTDCNNLGNGSCGLMDGSSAGDWRLPNINELRSLFDPGLPSPYLPNGNPFTNLSRGYSYATSTTSIGGDENEYVYYVDVVHGTGEIELKTESWYNVWPVRSQ